MRHKKLQMMILIRNKAYLANTKREIEQKSFKSYIEFLVNLNIERAIFSGT